MDRNNDTYVKMSNTRQTIAKKLLQSQQKTVTIYAVDEVDVSPLAKLKAGLKQLYNTNISITSFFVKACGYVLQEYPIVNSCFENDEILVRKSSNVSIAVATARGVVVPVIQYV